MLVEQPTAKPTRKVTAGATGGLVTVLAIAAVDYFVPGLGGEAGPVIAGFLVASAATISSYWTKERK